MPKLSDLLSDNSKKELLVHKKELKNTLSPYKKSKFENKKNTKETITHPFQFIIPEFVALDVETTGLDSKRDRIIEIGLVKFQNGKIVDEMSSFIDPETTIPEIITELTGIKDKDLFNAPKFYKIVDKILNFIGNLPICGHQVEFDIGFLKEELKRLSKEEIGSDLIDTALLARIVLFNNERFSLKKVCEILNVKLDNAHRALDDAKASGEIAIRLLPEFSKLPLSVRQNIALYSPASFFKNLAFKTIKGVKSHISIETRKEEIGSPSLSKDLSEKRIDDVLFLEILLKAKEKLSKIFKPSENLINISKKISNEIINSINSKSIYILEISCGYERLLTYTIPLVLEAISKKKKIILSIRDKKSKEILSKEILPFLNREIKSFISYTELKNKENYLCLYHFEELLKGRFGNLSPRERFAILPLIVWSNSSYTGDIEEQHSFNPKWFSKIWNLISGQNCSCTEKCPYFDRCFWQKAHRKANNSNIVIVNDSILLSNHQFLEKNSEEIFVIDDAHLLNYNCSKLHSVEIDTNRLNLFLDFVNNLYQLIENSISYGNELSEVAKNFNKILKHLRKGITVFLNRLTTIATSKSPDNCEYEFLYNEDFFDNFSEEKMLLYYLEELIEILIALKNALSFDDAKSFNFLKSIIQSTREIASQLKADFIYLTHANTENHLFIITGNYDKGWAKLKGIPLNNADFMNNLWNNHKGPIIFTSQAISISDSIEYFKEKIGLNRCDKNIKYDIFKTSDIDKENRIVLYSLNFSLDGSSKEFSAKIEDFITSFHTLMDKNILIISGKDEKLFEYYKNLKENTKIDKKKIFLNAITSNKHIELENITKNSKNILLSSEIFLSQLDLNEYELNTIFILDIPISKNNYNISPTYSISEYILKLKLYKGIMLNSRIKMGILLLLDNPFTEDMLIEVVKKSMDIEFKQFNNTNQIIDSIKEYYS